MAKRSQYIVQTGHGGQGWEEQRFIIQDAPSLSVVDGRVTIRRGDDLP